MILGGTLCCLANVLGAGAVKRLPGRGGRGEGVNHGRERAQVAALHGRLCGVAAAGRLLAVESHVLRYSADIHQSSWRLVEGRWCWIPQVLLSSKMPCPLIKNN